MNSLGKIFATQFVVVTVLASLALCGCKDGKRSEIVTATRADMQVIIDAVSEFKNITGNPPQSVEELTQPIGDREALLKPSDLLDAWGVPFQITLAFGAEVTGIRQDHGEKYQWDIRSSGPDKKMDTKDDIVLSHVWMHFHSYPEESLTQP